MSEPTKRKRPGPAGFQWHTDDQGTDDHSDEQHRTSRFRHTNVNLDATGTSSFSTAYTTAPASPKKRAEPSTNGPRELEDADDDILPTLIDQPDSDDEDEEIAPSGDAQLDLQYQQHLTILELADAPRAQKTRTPAVSYSYS